MLSFNTNSTNDQVSKKQSNNSSKKHPDAYNNELLPLCRFCLIVFICFLCVLYVDVFFAPSSIQTAIEFVRDMGFLTFPGSVILYITTLLTMISILLLLIVN